MTRLEQNNLQPCKHCGGKAKLVRVGDLKDYYAYRCANCGRFHARYNEARSTPYGARLVWNRRGEL